LNFNILTNRSRAVEKIEIQQQTNNKKLPHRNTIKGKIQEGGVQATRDRRKRGTKN